MLDFLSFPKKIKHHLFNYGIESVRSNSIPTQGCAISPLPPPFSNPHLLCTVPWEVDQPVGLGAEEGDPQSPSLNVGDFGETYLVQRARSPPRPFRVLPLSARRHRRQIQNLVETVVVP